jgi:hypothetical protein
MRRAKQMQELINDPTSRYAITKKKARDIIIAEVKRQKAKNRGVVLDLAALTVMVQSKPELRQALDDFHSIRDRVETTFEILLTEMEVSDGEVKK